MTSKLEKVARRTAVVFTVCMIAASFGSVAKASISEDDYSENVPTVGFWDGPK